MARDLAAGRISRRSALTKAFGASLAVALPASLWGADQALARCPRKRRCKGKCCPRHAHCRHGKCKCKSGYKKCGRKCVDLRTNHDHCGSCSTVCSGDETCIEGACRGPEPQVCGNGVIEGAEQCDGANLGGATCETLGFSGGTLACAGNCTYDTSGCTVPPTCGNGVIEGAEECDGANLGGATCQSLGFTEGTLACADNCTYDTSGCTMSMCGNGVIEGAEQCDGGDLGGATCETLGFTGGTLTCGPGCTYDTSGCTI